MSGCTRFPDPDFGPNPTSGIPFVVVAGYQPRVPINFDCADENDPGPRHW